MGVSKEGNDQHANAIACRLRLALLMYEAGAFVQWPARTDYFGYLSKISHVSSTCVLGMGEEFRLVGEINTRMRQKNGGKTAPLLAAREKYLKKALDMLEGDTTKENEKPSDEEIVDVDLSVSYALFFTSLIDLVYVHSWSNDLQGF
jgi:hypothetical protein